MDALRRISELLDSESLAVVATSDGGAPYCSLVAIAAPETALVYFATTRSTHKWENLSADPRVSVLVDNRRNYRVDFHEAAAANGRRHRRGVSRRRCRQRSRCVARPSSLPRRLPRVAFHGARAGAYRPLVRGDAIPAGRSRRLRRCVMSEAAPLTATLSEAGQLPVAQVGGKARSLGVLLGASLPAIHGIRDHHGRVSCVRGRERTVGAGRARVRAAATGRHARRGALGRLHTICSAFGAAPWPVALREEVARRIEAFVAAGPLVVRSSSPQEDSDSALLRRAA